MDLIFRSSFRNHTTFLLSSRIGRMSTSKKQVEPSAKKGKNEVDLKSLEKPDFWEERAALFDRLWEKQQAELAAKKAPIKVTLLNGKVIDAESFVTTPLDIAKKLSNSLAEKAIVAKVNEELWDLTRSLEKDSTVELLEWEDKDAQHVFWHSSSHVLGFALERVYQTKLSVGPALEEGGFFYEGQTNRPVSEGDFPAIEAAMQELVKEKLPYRRLEATKEQALELFHYSDFKSKILASKVPEGGTCTVYKCGMLIDPCRGPHIVDTGKVKAFAITKNSSSYFEGKAENEVLQRVYGIAFPKAALLSEWKRIQEEAAKRDHRVIGRQQNLFWFNEVSPGSAFWYTHGTRIYNKLVDFVRKQYRRRGFEEVISPNIYSSKLWMVSGHWDKYADNMFCTTCEKAEYGMKPMNCPGHCMLFASQQHSYKELPIRFADFGVLHRNELSGALTGLTRVRRFQQDDAHIFCRMDQVTDEISGALEFLNDTYGVFGFKFFLTHSTRPENKLGSEETWDEAEARLRESLNRFCDIPGSLPDPFHPGKEFTFDGKPENLKKLKVVIHKAKKGEMEWKGPKHDDLWTENPGDGAFYGPKIDIIVEDALRRRHQCATIQLDFNLPQRFGLKYTLATATDAPPVPPKEKHSDPEKSEEKPKTNYEKAVRELGIDLELDANQARPVMIHRAILGSLERFIAILCEHFGGEWPFWLSPRQIMVIPVASALNDYAQSVRDKFFSEGFFVDIDLGPATLDKKIRNAELARYNLIFVVGQKEEDAKKVNIRARGEKRLGDKTVDDALVWAKVLVESVSSEY